MSRSHVPREQQHFAPWTMLLNSYCQVDSVQLRHHHIGEQQVGSFKQRCLKGLNRVVECSGVKPAGITQNHCQGRCDDIFIIDDEYTERFAQLGHDAPPLIFRGVNWPLLSADRFDTDNEFSAPGKMRNADTMPVAME